MEVFNQLTFDPKARGTGTRLLNEIATGHNFFFFFSSDTNSFLRPLLLGEEFNRLSFQPARFCPTMSRAHPNNFDISIYVIEVY